MDPDIAPLAQRLAEENNVDWRSLEGTGENGRIVERDVLDYLARVMAGEEAVDPTPEPLPEGMEAWLDDEGRPIDATGEDVAPVGDDGPAPAVDEDEDLLLAGDDLLAGADAQDVASAEGTPLGSDVGPRASSGPDLFMDDEAEPSAGDAVPDLFEADAPVLDDAASGPTFDFGGLPGGATPAAPDATAEDAAWEEEAADAFTIDEPTPSPVDASVGTEPVGEDADVAAGPAPEAAPPAADAGEPLADAPIEEVPSAPMPVAPVAASGAAGPATGEWPLARVRTVVRRHVDLGGLLALQRAAALESGRDQVSALAVLLVVVRRAADRLDLGAPGAALPGGDGGVTAVVPVGRGIAEIAAELDAVERGERTPDDEADLWIADLSGLGVDEAILAGGVPQLTLGRVLSDEEDGALHGTLTFAGEHDLAHAAAFLARVADLLEEPLRLFA